MCEGIERCFVCSERPAYCTGRCVRCYRFKQRHGFDRPTEPAPLKLCSNCGVKPAFARGRCPACLSYFKRHHIERPLSLIEQAQKREEAAKHSAWWCKNCGSPDIESNMRCTRCARYFRMHGKERPRHLFVDDPRCKVCGKPLPTDGRRKLSGKCELCRHYEETRGKKRPAHLWGNGPHGWCECGQPAQHLIDKFPLCNGCAVEYQKGAYS